MKPLYSHYEDVPWENWTPVDRAVLMFIFRGDQVLLILKKRGLGAGKINAPGGRIEAGETPVEAAILETQEEILVRPTGLQPVGEMKFQFTNGHSIHCHVFRARGYDGGEPGETNEALPMWFNTNDLPYGRMWMDDRIWMPLMLQGRSFTSRWLFDDDQMLACRIDPLDQETASAQH